MSLDKLKQLLICDAEDIAWKVMARTNKIQAIKELRERHKKLNGYYPSLKDAKYIVELYGIETALLEKYNSITFDATNIPNTFQIAYDAIMALSRDELEDLLALLTDEGHIG